MPTHPIEAKVTDRIVAELRLVGGDIEGARVMFDPGVIPQIMTTDGPFDWANPDQTVTHTSHTLRPTGRVTWHGDDPSEIWVPCCQLEHFDAEFNC